MMRGHREPEKNHDHSQVAWGPIIYKFMYFVDFSGYFHFFFTITRVGTDRKLHELVYNVTNVIRNVWLNVSRSAYIDDVKRFAKPGISVHEAPSTI